MTPSAPATDNEALSRFQSLQSGQYWRSRTEIPEQWIDANETLLIESIRWVDDAPHTVILRPHPTKIGKQHRIEVTMSDGRKAWSHQAVKEMRFLVDDFLERFEFEPDHKRIREDELRQAQGRIDAIQKELVETQSDPARIAVVVEKGLRDLDAKEAAKRRPGDPEPTNLPALLPAGEAAAMASGTLSDAIDSGITEGKIVALKAAAEQEHRIATVKSGWITGKTGEIAEAIQAMTPFYAEQAAAALARTEDVREYVARLIRGIATLELYVGKGVEVVTLRTGASAPASEPLTFVQRKLMMDEELALWADVDERFDFESTDRFAKAIRDNDGLVEQIFPTPRCVLVMAITRRDIDYKDAWTSAVKNQENKRVFLLVRDGMNIHIVHSPVESHLGASRLFPSKIDQDAIFRGIDGSAIRFQDVAFTDRLTAHEAHALHYKRFLILVCGLDHRLKLFGDFHDRGQSLDFVSMEFQERFCRFLFDDEAALEHGSYPSLEDWVALKNAYLRSGSRVACNWHEAVTPESAPGAAKSSERGRGYIHTCTPVSDMWVAIAYKDGASICIDARVTGWSHTARTDVESNRRVDLLKLPPFNGYTEIAFLCLDAVEPDEIEHYLHSRANRRNHIAYIRFFKRALKHVRGEREQETDTRARMKQALTDGGIGATSERDALVGRAVLAWRAANRGRTLPSFENGVAPQGWKALLDQMFLLAGEGADHAALAEAFAAERNVRPLRLVATGSGRFALYVTPRDDERDDRLEPYAWVRRHVLEGGKKGFVEKSSRWEILPTHAASETTLHQWPEADAWSGRISSFGSPERKNAAMTLANGFADRLRPFTSTLAVDEHRALLAKWQAARQSMIAESKYVVNPALAAPIALIKRPGRKTTALCIGFDRPHVLFDALAPDDESRRATKALYISAYAKKQFASEKFDRDVSVGVRWRLWEVPLERALTLDDVFAGNGYGEWDEVGRSSPVNPLLGNAFVEWRKSLPKESSVWTADGALDAEGRLTIDALLGITLPKDYEPTTAFCISLHPNNGIAPADYPEWIDLVTTDASKPTGDWMRDTRIADLVGPKYYGKGYGVGGSTTVLATREAAREFVRSKLSSDGRVAVFANELPGAPQPPEGVERWFPVTVAVTVA